MIPAGSRFDFQPLPRPLHETASPLQQAVARWVLAHGGDATLARVAALASAADQSGDSAWRVEDAALRERLAAMPLVTDGSEADSRAPFVLDGDLFYLRRNFLHEIAAAALLRERIAGAGIAEESPPPLAGLFDARAGAAQHGQVMAVQKALAQRLFVLTGAPGTGKTTTLLRMLMAMARSHHARLGAWPRMVLAAPTGKAAQRMGEALAAAQAGDFPDEWHPALAQVQASESSTLHRLLGARGTRGGFIHGRAQPHPADIVIVDEASMLDLAMLRALLEALRTDAALVLVGDADQLDSVGTGSVLQDIVAALGEDSPRLQRLSHGFRSDPALQFVHQSVLQGDAAGVQAALQADPARTRWHPLAAPAALAAQVDAWSTGLLEHARRHGFDQAFSGHDPAAVGAALLAARERQLLSALRVGVFGSEGLNAAIESSLFARLADTHGEATLGEDWYPGRRIIITRNDPASGLFNGDVGLCLRGEDGRLRVWFEQGAAAPRAFEIATLPPHEAAFAMTVHKAQGSEYAHVGIVLPPDAEHPMLSRQWLYTAVSRARRSLEIWGSAAALAKAVTHRAQRQGRLGERIRTG